MTDQAQISADAELARRLQREELGGLDSLGVGETLFGPSEARFPDRRPTPADVRRAHEETRPELRLLSQLGVLPPRAPAAPRRAGGADGAHIDSIMRHFLAGDGNFGEDVAGDLMDVDTSAREVPDDVGRRLMHAHAVERRRARARTGAGQLPPPLDAAMRERTQMGGGSGLAGELDAMLEMMHSPPDGDMMFSFFAGGRGGRPRRGVPAPAGVGGAGGGRGGGRGGGLGGGPIGAMLRALGGASFFDEGGSSFEEMLEHINRQGNVSRGATDAEIEALPTDKYEPPKREVRAGAGPSSAPEEEREKCAICLAEFEKGETVKRLPCSHVFHDECIDRWLKVNKTCPMCKMSIRQGDGPS